MEKQFTLDNDLLKDPQFHKIKQLIEKIERTHVVENMRGNCISACDTMQHLLHQIGIDSEIVEVELTITRDGSQQANDILFIGFDDKEYQGQIDTHVVLRTKNKVPLIIDMSLAHVLPIDHPYIIERLNDKNNEMGVYSLLNFTLSYTFKKNIKLHSIHQKNLISRFLDEQNKIDKINFTQKLAYWAVGISVLDVIINCIILTHRLITQVQ